MQMLANSKESIESCMHVQHGLTLSSSKILQINAIENFIDSISTISMQ